ncbi:hypothetical protein [Asticcacaulis sp. AND118]|uniref:hypothetical protein n=1 Tax=Asticcacaulis sp. AND118 TaxID=2840468 RepID=UPI001CFFCD8B|nr:hypothetical protein [Asticcacaulis sp. AND118]UDF05350.1 hypothetical protein LH365_14165 [Asticcacaulis sp. AND118]
MSVLPKICVGAGAFAASLYASSAAFALEPKQCLSLDKMKAALAAEGQSILIIGDRKVINDAPELETGVRVTRYMNAVTSNADFTVGYQIEGDLPRVEKSANVCVRAKLANIRLYDARKPGTRKAFLFGGKFDAEVREKETAGTRPVIIADTVHTASDGTQQHGLPMVMFWHPKGHSATIYAVGVGNEPRLLVFMGDTELSASAVKWLDQTGGAR